MTSLPKGARRCAHRDRLKTFGTWRWIGAALLAVAPAAFAREARAQGLTLAQSSGASAPNPPADPAGGPAATDAKPPAKTFIFAGVISQLDYQWHGGPGVARYQKLSGLAIDNGFRMTRVGIRVGGRVETKWMFHAMAILGRSGADGQQRPANNPTVEDAWTGYDAHDLFKIRIGQFQVPYTLDANEFYPPNADFLEPTMMTRFVTAPEIRPLGIMAWGGNQNFLYSAGYINSAGKVTLTGTGDVIGRVAVRPFGSGPNFLQVGVGGRYGARDPANTWYDQPSLQNGTFAYNFWTPVYVTDLASEYHVIPSNQQRTGGIELLGSLGRVELAAEGVLVHQERREAQRAFLDRTVRSGTLSGATYYVSLGAWLLGPPKRPATARGVPYTPPKDPPPSPLEGITETPTSVQLVTRWEQIFLGYDSIARSPDVARGALDFESRRIRVNAFQAIVNVFVAKHIRLSLEYSTYITPGVPPKLLTDCSAIRCPVTPSGGTNQAIAPGAVQRGNITAGTIESDFTAPSPNAQTLQQIVTRFQVGF